MNSQLADLIEASFGSVWSLELLLRLRRDPARTWHPVDLVSELRSSDVIVQRSIGELTAAGLIVAESDGSVRYGPAGVQGGLVDELADEYERRPNVIRRMIVQNPTEKLRSFSDAFKLTKS